MSQWLTQLSRMCFLGVAYFAFVCAANAQDADMRTWWSHDGSESIRAALHGFDKKSKIVTLTDENDEKVTVKITLLSRGDRRFIARAGRKNPSVFQKSTVATDEESDKASADEQNLNSKSTGVSRRYGIEWTKGIENALAKAREEDNRKPVMWFRVLGDLNGLM